MPRSKSHDDPCADPVPCVAPARLRQALTCTPPLSPCVSPESSSKLYASPQTTASKPSGHVYVVRCDSSDSLSANESSALLKEEEKSISLSSLYYADEDIPLTGKIE